MSHKRSRTTPAGVLSKPFPETFGYMPNGKSIPYMFIPDRKNGILWLDERAGLGVLGAASALMNMKPGSWYIHRVDRHLLARLKRNPRLRADYAERITMRRVA